MYSKFVLLLLAASAIQLLNGSEKKLIDGLSPAARARVEQNSGYNKADAQLAAAGFLLGKAPVSQQVALRGSLLSAIDELFDRIQSPMARESDIYRTIAEVAHRNGIMVSIPESYVSKSLPEEESKEEPEEEDVCPICQGHIAGYQILTIGACGHAFHRGCLAQWLWSSGTCPMCRQEFKESMDVKIYPKSDVWANAASRIKAGIKARKPIREFARLKAELALIRTKAVSKIQAAIRMHGPNREFVHKVAEIRAELACRAAASRIQAAIQMHGLNHEFVRKVAEIRAEMACRAAIAKIQAAVRMREPNHEFVRRLASGKIQAAVRMHRQTREFKHQASIYALVDACIKKNTGLVQIFLSSPFIEEFNINTESLFHKTTALRAAADYNPSIIHMLVAAGANDIDYVNKKFVDEFTYGGFIVCDRLWGFIAEPDVDINFQGCNGRTALIWACVNNNPEVVRMLLERRDIDINVKDSDGRTALIWACIKNSPVIVQALLEQYDIDIDVKHYYARGNKTAKDIARSLGHHEIVELIERKEREKTAQSEMVTVIQAAIRAKVKPEPTWLVKDYIRKYFRAFLPGCKFNESADFYELSNDLKYIFVDACGRGNMDALQTIFSEPYLQFFNVNEDAQLVVAMKYGHLGVAKNLIKHGADVNQQDSDGKTALMLACANGQVGAVEMLLGQSGIGINQQDNNEKTALMLACANDHQKVVEMLLGQPGIDINQQDNNKKTALMLACANGQVGAVEMLLAQSGIAINQQDNVGETALMLACANGQVGAAKMLLDQPGIAINEKNNDGETALMLACAKGQVGAVEMLLDQPGIAINQQDNYENTALIHACKSDRDASLNIVEKLIQSGADVNLCNRGGYTPLMLVCKKSNGLIARALLASPGIDVHIKNKKEYNRNAKRMAELGPNNYDIIELIEQKEREGAVGR